MKFVRYFVAFTILAFLAFFIVGFFNKEVETTYTYLIDAPVEKTWDAFHDDALLPQWLTGLKRVETVKEFPSMIGNKYKMYFDQNGSELILTERITAWEENSLFEFVTTHESMDTENSYRFSDENGKTKIEYYQMVRPKNYVMRSLMPLIKPTMRNQNEESMKKFSALVISYE